MPRASAWTALSRSGAGVAVRSEHQHARARPAALEVQDGLGAGFHGGGEIRHDHVGLQIAAGAYRAARVDERAVEVQRLLLLQQGAQAIAQHALGVDHQHVGLATHQHGSQ